MNKRIIAQRTSRDLVATFLPGVSSDIPYLPGFKAANGRRERNKSKSKNTANRWIIRRDSLHRHFRGYKIKPRDNVAGGIQKYRESEERLS